MGRPLTYSPEVVQKIRELAEKGMRATEIAKQIGRNSAGVSALILRSGMKTQPRNCFPKGSDNPAWIGGRRIDEDGYVLVYKPEHPNAVIGYV